MAARKSGTGLLGKTETTILAILVLVILAWAYKTCQPDTPDGETSQGIVEKGKDEFPLIFISTDSLNMRSGPHLDSSIVSKLRLGEPLLYLNQRTPFRQKINFDGQLRNEPWVQVRTRSGLDGWIYAAGARFYPADDAFE